MKKFRTIGLFIALITSVSLTHAQDDVQENLSDDTLQVNLSDARQYALEHNKELLNAKEDIALSEAEYQDAKARGLPQVDGNMNYTTNFNYEFELGMRGGGETSMPDINYALLDQGDQELLTGLQQMLAPSGPTTIVMEDQLNAQARVSQLIFSGQYWVGLETAKIAKQLAEKQVQQTQLDVKQRITNTYYLILISERSLEILNQNLSNLQDVLQHTKNMYKMGLLEKTDVDQIRMDVSRLKNSL